MSAAKRAGDNPTPAEQFNHFQRRMSSLWDSRAMFLTAIWVHRFATGYHRKFLFLNRDKTLADVAVDVSACMFGNTFCVGGGWFIPLLTSLYVVSAVATRFGVNYCWLPLVFVVSAVCDFHLDDVQQLNEKIYFDMAHSCAGMFMYFITFWPGYASRFFFGWAYGPAPCALCHSLAPHQGH